MTIGTLKRLGVDLDGDVDVADVHLVTPQVAADLFERHYFKGARIDLLPPELQPSVYDMNVNAGANAAKLLQRLLAQYGRRVAVDGVIGPNTAAAVRAVVQGVGGSVFADAYPVSKGGYEMRATNRLTAGFMKSPPVGRHCGGAGLWLVQRKDGGAQWVLRVTIHGRRREMGLGGYPSVGLAQARRLAERWRTVASSGQDPIKVREAEERAARREDISLAIITADAFEARKAELKGDGTAGRWLKARHSRLLQAWRALRRSNAARTVLASYLLITY